ncbi:hypothetical protein BU26DRAFT_156572 [Trematosphaeria pertusa]|uniref:Uncharacterized protein n=1 Tax=Trematosphaeria pertusa TaxID=390896 RepID=A0A6A6IY46_9PLEO|nr:uncharacterized protein BU26DRAFT_156572 [Trematosphaeria pertusa]KAF2255471.1 hypothetical protein BU26DRAFT_156572 [Trematosphaeria pertusa]
MLLHSRSLARDLARPRTRHTYRVTSQASHTRQRHRTHAAQQLAAELSIHSASKLTIRGKLRICGTSMERKCRTITLAPSRITYSNLLSYPHTSHLGTTLTAGPGPCTHRVFFQGFIRIRSSSPLHVTSCRLYSLTHSLTAQPSKSTMQHYCKRPSPSPSWHLSAQKQKPKYPSDRLPTQKTLEKPAGQFLGSCWEEKKLVAAVRSLGTLFRGN